MEFSALRALRYIGSRHRTNVAAWTLYDSMGMGGVHTVLLGDACQDIRIGLLVRRRALFRAVLDFNNRRRVASDLSRICSNSRNFLCRNGEYFLLRHEFDCDIHCVPGEELF
jgi:hypothetical protein